MNKTKFISGVATACHVVFSVMKVLTAIGAVCILLGVFSLTILPQGTFSLENSSDVKIHISLAALTGDTWETVREDLLDQFDHTEGTTITEDGITISETSPAETMENRSLALAMIPVFAELLIQFFFYRYLSRAAAAIKNSLTSPFPPEASKQMKSAGISLFFLAGAPALCSWLITLLTLGKFENPFTETTVDLSMVLWGFVLMALSYIFEYGASLVPTSVFTPERKSDEGTPPLSR